jgi:hypothetical protein
MQKMILPPYFVAAKSFWYEIFTTDTRIKSSWLPKKWEYFERIRKRFYVRKTLYIQKKPASTCVARGKPHRAKNKY